MIEFKIQRASEQASKRASERTNKQTRERGKRVEIVVKKVSLISIRMFQCENV